MAEGVKDMGGGERARENIRGGEWARGGVGGKTHVSKYLGIYVSR